MSTPTASQIGYAAEPSWGQPTTPARFLPVLTSDLAHDPQRLESEAVVAGLDIIGADQWNGGNIVAGGNVGHELHAGGLDLLFQAAIGAPDVTGTGPYTKVFKPAAGELGSLTIQTGHPVPGASVQPRMWPGSKVSDWEIGCSVGAIATLGLGFTARDCLIGSRQVTDAATTSGSATVTSASAAFDRLDVGKPITGSGIPAGTVIAAVGSATSVTVSANATATATGVTATIGAALATASYAAGSTKPLKFNHGALTVHGSTVAWKEVKVAGNNALAERRFGGDQRIHEQLREGRRTYAYTVKKELLGLDCLSKLINGDMGSVALDFTAGAATVRIEGYVRFDAAASKLSPKAIADEDLTLTTVLPSGSTDLGDAFKVTTINAAATV